MYTLTGPDGRPYPSPTPGALGGHRRGRLYGRLDCPSALRALARGGYQRQRVFFADETTALAAGYRPCAVCLPDEYAHWKDPQALDAAQAHDPAPPRHTEAEVATLVDLLTGRRPRVETVTLGHGRDAASTAAVQAFAQAWEGRGGHILAVVTWPEEAASWLRPATRFAAGDPDAWVVAGAAPGWAGMSRRLRHSTAWDPARTFAFASIGGIETLRLAGPGTLDGLRGACADGGTWRIGRHSITHHGPDALGASPPAGPDR
ncbi:Ada metal-binding domain-containing protein [Nonomuraea jiangxiensis]|uniref:Metal binding domain of Ada n=1 Tax=Nonomuraea jiangxiensis TaxID=633440 RepID=A0A1G8A014_9ACTN|nr:Ada metal-binding domain-containing protein [Nonomuraea jiangxiensis]SDH13760.1 Metal binding domain of Ada [Nonomuraea jiangxiensis]